MPEIPESNASKSGRERAIALAEREKLTVRQLAGRLGGFAGLAMLGTPQMIADQMEEWLISEGSDGFNVMFPYLPGGLDGIVTLTAWLRHGRCFSVSGCARYPTVVTAFHRSSSSMPSGSIAVSR